MDQKKSLKSVLETELKYRQDIQPEELERVLQYLQKPQNEKENRQDQEIKGITSTIKNEIQTHITVNSLRNNCKKKVES